MVSNDKLREIKMGYDQLMPRRAKRQMEGRVMEVELLNVAVVVSKMKKSGGKMYPGAKNLKKAREILLKKTIQKYKETKEKLDREARIDLQNYTEWLDTPLDVEPPEYELYERSMPEPEELMANNK